MTESNTALLLAEKLGMKILYDLPLDSISKDLLEKISYTFVRKNLTLPLEENSEQVVVAIADPLNLQALDELHFLLEKNIVAIYAPEEKILAAINCCYHKEEGTASKFIAHLSQEASGFQSQENHESSYDLLEDKEDAPLIRLLNLILSEAIHEGASDIHFEPLEEDLRIRYRIDGVLQTRHLPNKEYHCQLITRIKVLAKLDIAEHRLPQDGRIKLTMGGKEIDLRVSTLPITCGERVVLRILDRGNVAIGLDEIGMLPSVVTAFRKLITTPEGIILVTGPTGSGKTTTLYSALCELLCDDVNIMTIEDPVEYKLSGINQIAVHPKIGLTFATGLRHILRQDPDIVMLGEIRDAETAEIAIQAALTGHLVLSTLHTNDAPSAIPRLLDMGVEPYLVSSTVLAVLAQRLVRKVCSECKEEYLPSEEEIAQMGMAQKKLFRGRGCKNCFYSGYKGRHGIYELMPITATLQSQIVKKQGAQQLRSVALEEGLLSLWEHGVQLACAGITTFAEVLRVTRR